MHTDRLLSMFYQPMFAVVLTPVGAAGVYTLDNCRSRGLVLGLFLVA